MWIKDNYLIMFVKIKVLVLYFTICIVSYHFSHPNQTCFPGIVFLIEIHPSPCLLYPIRKFWAKCRCRLPLSSPVSFKESVVWCPLLFSLKFSVTYIKSLLSFFKTPLQHIYVVINVYRLFFRSSQTFILNILVYPENYFCNFCKQLLVI